MKISLRKTPNEKQLRRFKMGYKMFGTKWIRILKHFICCICTERIQQPTFCTTVSKFIVGKLRRATTARPAAVPPRRRPGKHKRRRRRTTTTTTPEPDDEDHGPTTTLTTTTVDPRSFDHSKCLSTAAKDGALEATPLTTELDPRHFFQQ